MSPDTPLDAERILQALAKCSVDYVIVGGLAVQTHGHVRTTSDVDLFPAPDPPNLARWPTLSDHSTRGSSIGDGHRRCDVAQGDFVAARHSTWSGRCAARGPGAPSYEELRARALIVKLGDMRLAIAGRDDLIAMKRASAQTD